MLRVKELQRARNAVPQRLRLPCSMQAQHLQTSNNAAAAVQRALGGSCNCVGQLASRSSSVLSVSQLHGTSNTILGSVFRPALVVKMQGSPV